MEELTKLWLILSNRNKLDAEEERLCIIDIEIEIQLYVDGQWVETQYRQIRRYFYHVKESAV